MQTYIELALELKMLHGKFISPEGMVFDIRTLLKCAADDVRNRYWVGCVS